MINRVAAINGQFYDGVLDAEAWTGALESMRRCLNASVFHYFTLDSAGRPVPPSAGNVESYGLREEMMREYELHHAANDVRMSVAARMAEGEIMLDHEHLSERELSRNSVYADWLLPTGLKHTAAATSRIDGTSRDFVSFMRPRDAAAFSAEDKRFFEFVVPELGRAARLRARMTSLARQASLGLAALDRLSQGILTVDHLGSIEYANAAAESLFGDTSPVRAHSGSVSCSEPRMHAMLLQMIAGVCNRPPSSGGAFQCGLGAHRRVVTVLPLREHHPAADLRQRPMALLVVVNPHDPAMLSAGQVDALLGLSPMEAKLALLLAASKTIKDFALVEGISWHTARTHAKNLMRKTGCHRQVELVSLLQAMRWG